MPIGEAGGGTKAHELADDAQSIGRDRERDPVELALAEALQLAALAGAWEAVAALAAELGARRKGPVEVRKIHKG